jgi:general L-amino acid transport system permease protein
MIQKTQTQKIKPPVVSIGIIGWVKANLFNGWFNSALTIVTFYLLWKIIPAFFRWAFIDSVWRTTGEACRDTGGPAGLLLQKI